MGVPGEAVRTFRTESDLREAFQAFGTVEKAAIITDKGTGPSRGFGFVEMPNREEATKAVGALNGKDLKGRALKVNLEGETPSNARFALCLPFATVLCSA